MTKYGKKKFHYKSGEETGRSRNSLRSQLADPKARSKLISGPTDFKHVHHMGAENTNVQNMMAADLTQQKVRFVFWTYLIVEHYMKHFWLTNLQKKGEPNLVIGAPLNFKHVYHFGGGQEELNSDQLSTQTSSTMLRSANSSDLGEKSPTQSDVIDKKYSRRSFYKDDYWTSDISTRIISSTKKLLFSLNYHVNEISSHLKYFIFIFYFFFQKCSFTYFFGDCSTPPLFIDSFTPQTVSYF